MEVPGLTPTFPLMIVAPVLVTAEPPKMVNSCAFPKSETVWALIGQHVASNPEISNTAPLATWKYDLMGRILNHEHVIRYGVFTPYGLEPSITRK